MALGTALAIQAGTTLAGTLANELLNPDPEIPNLSAEAAAEFNERRRDLADVIERREREMEADLAASGQTGSAGATTRQRVASEFADAQADLSSDAARAVAEAERREERLRFQQESQEQAQRAQGIAQLVGGVGQTLAADQLLGEENFDPDEPGEGTSSFGEGVQRGGATVASAEPLGTSLANVGRDLLENKYGMSTS